MPPAQFHPRYRDAVVIGAKRISEKRAVIKDRGNDVRTKEDMERKLSRQAEGAPPEFREGVDVMPGGSPRTFTLRGSALAGNSVFPGPGAPGVSESGFNAAVSAARVLAWQSQRIAHPA